MRRIRPSRAGRPSTRPSPARGSRGRRRRRRPSAGRMRSSSSGRSARLGELRRRHTGRSRRRHGACSRDRRLLLAADGDPARSAGTTDPSLNVDPTRNGIEPDIAFTGANDSVPWVVWYETDATIDRRPARTTRWCSRPRASATAWAPTAASTGWRSATPLQGTLDTTGTHHFGTCAAIRGERAAVLAERRPGRRWRGSARRCGDDDRRATRRCRGSPGTKTSPASSRSSSRGSSAPAPAAQFQIVNGGKPISTGTGDATRPDITFSGNTPYVTWRQNVGGVDTGFVGHLSNATNPVFVLDASNVALTPTAQADVREPISSAARRTRSTPTGRRARAGRSERRSSCTRTGPAPRRLFAKSYQPGDAYDGRGDARSPRPRRRWPDRSTRAGRRRTSRSSSGRRPPTAVRRRRRRRLANNQVDAFSANSERTARRDDDPLSGGGAVRLRDPRGRRPDVHDRELTRSCRTDHGPLAPRTPGGRGVVAGHQIHTTSGDPDPRASPYQWPTTTSGSVWNPIRGPPDLRGKSAFELGCRRGRRPDE